MRLKFMRSLSAHIRKMTAATAKPPHAKDHPGERAIVGPSKEVLLQAKGQSRHQGRERELPGRTRVATRVGVAAPGPRQVHGAGKTCDRPQTQHQGCKAADSLGYRADRKEREGSRYGCCGHGHDGAFGSHGPKSAYPAYEEQGLPDSRKRDEQLDSGPIDGLACRGGGDRKRVPQGGCHV